MKKINLFTILVLCLFLSATIIAQVSLPYYSGFDNTTQQSGWTENKNGATTFSHWEYSSTSAYSTPNCITHDFSPSAGITLTDNWFVSPAFSIGNGGKIDSIRYKFSGFSEPLAGDTVAIYLINGSQDPSLATSKQLLFDFRNTEYISDDTYRVKTDIMLPPLVGSSHIAIRYRNTDCSSNWLTVFFDNLAISGNTLDLNELNQNKLKTNIFPNPFSISTNIEFQYSLVDATLTIYNSKGNQVRQIKNIDGNSIKLEKEALSNGIYFITLTQNNTVLTTEKLIISNN